MTGSVLGRAKALLVRGLAVAAVVLTYALGGVGTQILSTVGVSSLVLATSATPADAQWRRRRRWRRRRYWAPRRRWRRRWWW